MNTVLLATTIFASAVALAASIALFVFWRTFHDEQRRSHARVAALRQMAGDVQPAARVDVPPIDVYDLMAADAGPVGRSMFSEEARPSPWGHRLAAAAAVAVVVAIGGYILVPRHSRASNASTVRAGSAAAAPLELLSLRDAQEDGRLTITGLVQNPRAGTPLTRVVATAFVFAADGTFLASGRAPLDFSTLAPGDESPFVITIPVKGGVARYRVGFRSEDGNVIGHVDRRAAGTLARSEEDQS
jgi:hypothetical protein